MSQHFGLKADSQCLEMANPEANSKQRLGSSLWICLMHFYSFSYATHTVYRTEIPTLHKETKENSSLYAVSFSQTPSLSTSSFYCFPKCYCNFRHIRYKNAQQKGKKNRTDSSACVCPLGWARWVNKGKKKSKWGSSRDQEALPPVGL